MKILLISYDNGSHIPFFPQNLFYLYGALRFAKHQVGLWLADIHHGTPKDLTRLLDDAGFDMVAFGFVAGYYQYRFAKQLAKAINLSRRRRHMKFVVGGHGPAAAPEFSMEQLGCDTVVVGDGEDLGWVDLPGGIYNAKPCESDAAPIGCYLDFPLDIYRLIRWPTSGRRDFCFPILSSRGCRWHCSFCYRMRPGFHERAIEAIMEEVRWLHDQCQINHFQFSDELLMSSEKRTEDMQFNLEATFLNEMGLQWTFKLCNPNNIIIDEGSWMRIYQLWHRVLKSGLAKPDAQGLDGGADNGGGRGNAIL